VILLCVLGPARVLAQTPTPEAGGWGFMADEGDETPAPTETLVAGPAMTPTLTTEFTRNIVRHC
jgi:hypothetical protein